MKVRIYMSKTVKIIGFVLIGILIFRSFPKPITTGECENYNYQMSAGFFEESKGSLDMIYIGASPTFTSWVAPVAYGKYGITSRVLANDGQPFVAAEALIKIARKSHPDAVYLICINGLYESCSVEQIHRTTDFLPNSKERDYLIQNLCNYFQYDFGDWVELELPIIRYHSRWNTLGTASVYPRFNNLKGGFSDPNFLGKVTDISQGYCETDERKSLPDFTQTALTELLDYCLKEDIQAIFILSAQYRDEQMIKWYNTMIDEIETQGFPIVNELADFNKIGLDDTTDFYNANHTNIHGALKISDYLSRYLLSHYDFPEKSNGGGYEGWDEAYDKYKEIITPYLTEEELSNLP